MPARMLHAAAGCRAAGIKGIHAFDAGVKRSRRASRSAIMSMARAREVRHHGAYTGQHISRRRRENEAAVVSELHTVASHV